MAPKDKVLGIIFPNMHDEAIPELTSIRTMASVPFGGRYRMIDFVLSGLVAAGVEDICVVPRTSYVSLMDHVGSGKEWDLARKRGGLKIFPPYGEAGTKAGKGKLGALATIINVIEDSSCEYVLLADCGIISALDYEEVIEKHIESKADITIVYNKDTLCENAKTDNVTLDVRNGKVCEMLVNDVSDKVRNCGMWVYVVNKDLLVEAINTCASKGLTNFERDVVQAAIGTLEVKAYEYTGYAKRVTNLKTYYEANLDLCSRETLGKLFRAYPVYTKVRDDAPVRYTIGSSVKNTIAADGCFVEGSVEGSVLFRGVKVGKGATVKNCVLMQDTVVEEGVTIENVISDKAVVFTANSKMLGTASHPVYIEKKAKV
ncbi:MAG: glucose-1-phosphate adenylyltransferase subunit GlgD [Oscillospiraceae bacterium]|nr:glucose-1-phosphate adenylyltransferase subunit GlgD [Oscillospiraceae bacterium]